MNTPTCESEVLTVPTSPTEERTILGAILEGSGEAYDLAAQQGLASEDFHLSSHRLIYSVLADMAEAGESTDIVSAAGRLRDRGQLAQVGGEAYLADLIGGVVYEHGAFKGYVKRVRDVADRRRLISACQATASHACENGSRAEECMDLLGEKLLSLRAGSLEAATKPIGGEDDYSAWSQLADRGETRLGLRTGLASLDCATGGIRAGEYWLVGGRTSDGKTSFGLQAGGANCANDVPVMMFSLEMSREELKQRLWAQESSVPFSKIRNPAHISSEDRERIRRADEKINCWPFFVNDTGSLGVQKLCSLARIAVRQHKIQLIIIDYLQLISCPARDERERLTKVSNTLRTLAKTVGVPIMAISQLSRPRDGNQNSRPNRFSLKESGSLENDAHSIVLVYRPTSSCGQPTGEDELIIAKQRHGPVGIEKVYFNPECLRFYERDTYMSDVER